MGRMRTALSTTAAAVCVTVAAGACGGGYSSDVTAYIPKSVDGHPVDRKSAYGKTLEQSLRTSDVREYASGVVGAPTATRPQPDLAMAAASGPDESIGKLQKQVVATFGGTARSTTIDGVTTRLYSLQRPGARVTTAVARPRPDMLLVAVAFTGGTKAAESAIAAMLSAGKG